MDQIVALPIICQTQRSLNQQLGEAKHFAQQLGIGILDHVELSPLSDLQIKSLSALPALKPQEISAEYEALVMRTLCNRLGLYDAADYF